MTDTGFDLDFADQQIALRDTIAWDAIYARACRQARDTGFAQLILERAPARYVLINGSSPDALKLRRLRGANIHVVLDWT